MPNFTSQPIRYRVVVRGRLGGHVVGAFEQVLVEAGAEESALTGTFADRAQLYGLLDRLRDLGIALISVNPVS